MQLATERMSSTKRLKLVLGQDGMIHLPLNIVVKDIGINTNDLNLAFEILAGTLVSYSNPFRKYSYPFTANDNMYV